MGDSSYAGAMGMAGPAVIADAYDLYADQLYAYCRFFARDPVDAVDVLENVFLVAAGRGAALPLDGQLRAWLFAVARNECLRRTSRRAAAGPGRRPGGPSDRRTERDLLTTAAGGLPPGDRDLVALLWHGLDADDIASVLGTAREEALTRLETALGRLEATAGALLLTGPGLRDCPGLARLLSGWNGRLDVALAQAITQHAGRCGRCLARRQAERGPALLISLPPAALLGAGVSAEALRPAAASVAELRDEVLNLACDPSAEGGAARRRACRLAGPFGLSLPGSAAGSAAGPVPRAGNPDVPQWTGFPVPLPAEPVRGLPRTRLTMALTGAVTVALTAAAGFAVAGEPGRDPQPEAASASLSPVIRVPPAVTLRWNPDRTELEGVLTVTVTGGPLAWSVSARDRELRLSQGSGTLSARIRIAGPSAAGLQPLFVTSGNATYTVTLTEAP